MQLPLSFAQEPPSQTESIPDVWKTLDADQRNETLAVLVRLLAKTAAANARSDAAKKRKEDSHD
jgi:hypothetical protein